MACPTQVTVGSPRLARRALPSLATRGSVMVRGETIEAQMRLMKNVVRVQNGGREYAGLVLANPFSR